MKKKAYKTIDGYIASFPIDTQNSLEEMRMIIKEIVPEAEETISYQMPTFKYHGNLVHFAAYEKHIGFYPTPSAIIKFKNELKKYKTSKGTIQFETDKKIPVKLIKDIVKFRVAEVNKKKIKK